MFTFRRVCVCANTTEKIKYLNNDIRGQLEFKGKQ